MSLSASKSAHKPFKRNALDCSHPLSHRNTISAGFYSQKFLEFLLPALETGALEAAVGL